LIRLQAPSVVLFGAGCAASAGAEVRRLGARSAFLVTTRGMPGREVFTRLLQGLDEAGVAVTVWAGTPAEPGTGDLEACRAAAAEARPDAILGLGGGSALDLAKLTAMLLVNGGPVEQYFGTGRVPRRGLPTVLLPTTAGSGSEVSPDAVLTDRAAGTKRAVKDPALVPDVAVVDPEATLTCPPDVTAASGLDALVHAVESYTARKSNPLTEVYALGAVRDIRDHLPTAIRSGADAAAREGMARAALFAGRAFGATGTAAVHACGYPLTARWGLPHGIANAMMLPAVVAFNEPCGRYGPLRALFGTGDLPAALHDFVVSCGVLPRLRDAGIPQESIPAMAAIAATDERHLSANPLLMSVSDLEAVFRQAW
jgi:alcohol dehydrogenase class IV